MQRALLVLLALAAAAPARGAGPSLEIKEWTLPNGLRVVFAPVRRAPVVTVQVWYHAGSKDEPRDRRGTAHMFEHMMFKGTTNVPPEEHARLIDRIGGRENAFTTEDVTAYHDTVPRGYLDFAMQLEAERMRNLVFRRAMVASEREVVKEEKRARIDNSPVGRAMERFRQLAYTKHPYAWTAAGDIGDLDRLTPEELKRFYDTYYVPANAALIVVGDVSEEEVREAAQRRFGAIPAGAAPIHPAAATPEPPQLATRREVVGTAQFGVVLGGYHIPAARSADIPALEVAARILATGESSRLYQRVVARDASGVFAGGDLGVLEDPGLAILFAVYLDPAAETRVEAAILDEVGRLGKELCLPAELDKAKSQARAQAVFALEQVEGIAVRIGQSLWLRGSATAWLGDVAAIEKVTAEDVRRVARTYLVPENLTVVVLEPGGRP